MKHTGAAWIKSAYKTELSPLGENVANLLDEAYQGIYHIEDKLKQTDWANDYCITVLVPNSNMATWDFNTLTMLVVRSHDRMLRMSIHSHHQHWLKLVFHQRQREGDFSRRIPTIEDHIALIRKAVDAAAQ